MQTLPQPTEIKTTADTVAFWIVVIAAIVRAVWPVISKVRLKKTDTGETRKALAGVIGDMQVKIEALEKVNADLTNQNANLKADNEALVIRINNLESDLKVLRGVVEVLRKPPAPPAETQPITKEDDKEAG